MNSHQMKMSKFLVKLWTSVKGVNIGKRNPQGMDNGK